MAGVARAALAALVVALLLALGAPARAAGLGTTQYDGCIRKAASTWWPAGPDWLWWRAQLWQESRLDPAAVSPAGARGLAQVMPGTWRDVAPALGFGLLSPHAACPAVEVGAYYMARQHRTWSAPRPHMERHRLAQASYNAGAGHIIKAQALCGGARDWSGIAPCLPQVTGRHARETTDYVRLIAQWRAMMD